MSKISDAVETDTQFRLRLGRWFRHEQMSDAQRIRAADIAANPSKYTIGTGKIVRRRRLWAVKKNYSVEETFEDGHKETRLYASLAELAREKGLCHDTLRHMVSNDRAGAQVKSNRYRRYAITKIGALAARAQTS